jgi:lipopolysaccharide assembly outer membrane protein LptD (OstA)
MQKKTLIQLTLLLLVFAIIIIFYKSYFEDLSEAKIGNVIKKDLSKEIVKKGINQIDKVSYTSQDLEGNSYSVKSDFGEFDQNKPDIMLLTNVEATILTKNSEPITIYSKKSLYNNINYNTNFYEDVRIIYKNHRFLSNNFDLNFNEKIGTIYNNVIYKNLNTMLYADKIDIDLISKNSKIYMFDKSKKVKIKNLD